MPLTPEQRRQYIDQNLVKNEDGKVTAKIGKYKIEITLEKAKYHSRRPSDEADVVVDGFRVTKITVKQKEKEVELNKVDIKTIKEKEIEGVEGQTPTFSNIIDLYLRFKRLEEEYNGITELVAEVISKKEAGKQLDSGDEEKFKKFGFTFPENGNFTTESYKEFVTKVSEKFEEKLYGMAAFYDFSNESVKQLFSEVAIAGNAIELESPKDLADDLRRRLNTVVDPKHRRNDDEDDDERGDDESIAPENSKIIPLIFATKLPTGESYTDEMHGDSKAKLREAIDKISEIYFSSENKQAAKEALKNYIRDNYDELKNLQIGSYLQEDQLEDAGLGDDEIDTKEQQIELFANELIGFLEISHPIQVTDEGLERDGLDVSGPTTEQIKNFHNKIGLTKDRNGENKIAWRDSATLSPEQEDVEQFFFQRLLIRANLHSLEKDLVKTNENLIQQGQPAKTREEFLQERYAKKSADDENFGLAKTTNDGTSLSPQGLAMNLAFFEMQEERKRAFVEVYRIQNPTLATRILKEMDYQTFARLVNTIGRANNEETNDVAHDVSALIYHDERREVFWFLENYVYKAANDYVASKLGILYNNQDNENHTASQLPRIFSEDNSRNKVLEYINSLDEAEKAKFQELSQLFEDGDFKGKMRAAYEAQKNYKKGGEGKESALEKLKEINADEEFKRKNLQAQKDLRKLYEYYFDNVAKEVIEEALKLDIEEQRKLYQKSISEVEGRFAEVDVKSLDGFADGVVAKIRERSLMRAIKSPPKLADVSLARKAIVGALEEGDDGKPKLPDFITQNEDGKLEVRYSPENYELHKKGYEFKEFKGNLNEVETEFEKIKDIEKGDLSKNSQGDNILASAADKNFLNYGFLVSEFNKPSCLADFAIAVSKMPNDFAKKELAANRPVFNVALLSGDDGQKRDNKIAFVRQVPGYKAPIVTFTTETIFRKEVYDKSEEFFNKQIEAEARLSSLKHCANLNIVYLNDLIASKYREKNDDGSSKYNSPEDVLELPEIQKLSRFDYYMRSCLGEFGFKENDSPEIREAKISRLENFAKNGFNFPRQMEGNEDDIFSLSDLTNSIEASFAQIEGKEPAESSLAKRFSEVSAQIKSPEKSLDISEEVVNRAKKYSSLEVQKYLERKEISAKEAAKEKFQLDAEDVEVMESGYYRLSSLRPNFTKSGESEFRKLLQSEIPKAPFPGITIYKPKGRYGEEKTSVVSFDLPSDPEHLDEFDDIAWIYLPGTPECYVKARVVKEDSVVEYYKDGKLVSKECKAGEILIDEGVIWHKGSDGYTPTKSNKKSLKKAFGDMQGAAISRVYNKFSVLAVSSIDGDRKGVSALFKEGVVNKSEEKINARISSKVDENEMERLKNFSTTFNLDDKGRVVSSPDSLGLLEEGLGLEEYGGKVSIFDIELAKGLLEKELTLDGVAIPKGKFGKIEIVFGLNLASSDVSGKFNFNGISLGIAPKIVTTYLNERGEEVTKVLDFSEENYVDILQGNKEAYLGICAKIEEEKKKFSKVKSAQPIGVKNGKDLPKYLGEFKEGVNSSEFRVVRQVIACDKGKKDNISLGSFMIEYFEKNQTNPSYMTLNRENLSEFYGEEISEENYNKFAAQLESSLSGAKYSIAFKDEKGSESTVIVQDGKGLDISGKNKTPSSSPSPSAAKLFFNALGTTLTDLALGTGTGFAGSMGGRPF